MNPNALLAALPPFVTNNVAWLLPALIVAAGLFLYGIRDVLRLSPGRLWAISDVCFRDAVRRRVLWITPLAMLGIFVVSQLQKPIDEQDAIRLTVKLCFFTTGIVVTIIAIITACTNLPREIESRVVYTIVTKPVTRLEIILGKLTGFARISGAILLAMGLFSFIYLESRAWWLGRQIDQTLLQPSLDGSTRNWLSHFQQTGLLVSQSEVHPRAMMQYARQPTTDRDRWILGGAQDAWAAFNTPPEVYKNVARIAFVLRIPYEAVDAKHPPAKPPVVSLQLIDPATHNVVIPAEQFTGSAAISLSDAEGKTPVAVDLSPERASQIAGQPGLAIQIVCPTPEFLYELDTNSVTIGIVDASGKTSEIKPFAGPILRGTSGRNGQQLSGPERGVQPLAVFQFRDSVVKAVDAGQISMQLNAVIEHSGSDAESGVPTEVEARIYDRPKQRLSPPVKFNPESRRTAFFTLPAEYLTADPDGSYDFDVVIRNKTPGHTVSISEANIVLVTERSSFAVNLLKGLVVLWLFTILTAAVALCASTFLSWPIAVVLTVLIILGNWMVSNLDLGTGLGAQIAQEFFQSNSGAATAVNQTVESLSKLLQLIAAFLPAIGSFGISDQIEAGVTITVKQFLAPLWVLIQFGLPLITAAYVFLRNKEVAP